MKLDRRTLNMQSCTASGLIYFLVCVFSGGCTPLDDYVNRPDPTYTYRKIDEFRGDGYTMHIINMTSQKWKDESVLNQPIWWHYLTVTIPDQILIKDAAFLLIDGGSNHDKPPKITDNFVTLTTMMAVSTGAVGADLKMVPNQPLLFKADPQQKQRSEDAIIAWTWKTFVDQNGSDPEILLRMPMTKAAVRALDTITDFVNKTTGLASVNRFYVAGASKRGWTTWTTAAVDQRVVAFSPIVMDLTHMQKNLHHYFRSLGGWTFAFDDYYALNFTADLDRPQIQMMADIIDPISYLERYVNKPKLIISTGGDEFFMIDDSHYYFSEMTGPTYLRMLPNAEHSLAGHETSLLFDMRSFFMSVVTGAELPEMKWSREYTATGGKITLMTSVAPTTVACYHARTLDGKRKDFRLVRGTPGDPSKPQVHPVIWLSEYVEPLGNNTFEVEFQNPDVGWLAFFIQVTFPGLRGSVLEFTTETQIIPNTFPFPDCSGEQCRGTLV